MIGNIVNTYAIAQLETTRLVLQIDNEDKNTLLLKDSFRLKENRGGERITWSERTLAHWRASNIAILINDFQR